MHQFFAGGELVTDAVLPSKCGSLGMPSKKGRNDIHKSTYDSKIKSKIFFHQCKIQAFPLTF